MSLTRMIGAGVVGTAGKDRQSDRLVIGERHRSVAHPHFLCQAPAIGNAVGRRIDYVLHTFVKFGFFTSFTLCPRKQTDVPYVWSNTKKATC